MILPFYLVPTSLIICSNLRLSLLLRQEVGTETARKGSLLSNGTFFPLNSAKLMLENCPPMPGSYLSGDQYKCTYEVSENKLTQ